MRKWYPAVLIAAAYVFSAIVYPRLPNPMPVHWDIHGHVNGYGKPFVGAFLMPTMALGIWALLRWLPLIDPRRPNYAKFQGTYDLVIDVVVTVLVAVHVMAVGRVLGWPLPIERVVPLAVGAVLIVVGNLLPRARSNWWFGIRTPWTLSSDTVWAKTHRLGGYLMIAAGVVVILAMFLPDAWILRTVLGASVIAGLAPVVYSYFAWKGEQA